MRRFSASLCVALAAARPLLVVSESRVKHLVVLMMENHSFDNSTSAIHSCQQFLRADTDRKARVPELLISVNHETR